VNLMPQLPAHTIASSRDGNREVTTYVFKRAQRVIGKCACGKVSSALCVGAVMIRVPGKGSAQFATYDRFNVAGWSFDSIQCHCGNMIKVKRVAGVLDPHTPCDERCTRAKGNSCKCSCAGEFHGADHA